MPLTHVSFFKRQIHLHKVVIGRFILINSWWIDIVLFSLYQYTQGGGCHDVVVVRICIVHLCFCTVYGNNKIMSCSLHVFNE